MDRLLVVNAQLPIRRGHRIEVSEVIEEDRGDAIVVAVVDLETGIRYRRAEDPRGELLRWRGRVLDCTITFGGHRERTTLTIDVDGDGARAAATGAKAALHGADAAVEAAKAEADRWGGGDRMPEPEAERFW